MSIQDASRLQESHAPNAILERMRRRITHVGLLVAFVAILLTVLAILVLYVCVRFR